VSVSGPSFRLPTDRLPEVATQVVAAARRISAQLGWFESDDGRALTSRTGKQDSVPR
jgi:hypothetical protein